MWSSWIRELSADSGDGDAEDTSDDLFNVAIATIFAREVLEGAIIIGQYRTVILKSTAMDDERKAASLKAVTYSATVAALVAILVVIAVAVPLGILSSNLDERVIMIVEGVSKVVAAVCILQLSLKLPVWLGLYRKGVSLFYYCGKTFDPEQEKNLDNLTLKEIRFNVAWNIWREVAECGVFLIPFFLGTGVKAIPISALVGIAISVFLGLGIYWANNRLQDKRWLAVVMSGLTLFLSVGLFVGGCHEFEEVWGETNLVYAIENPFWSSKSLPMVLLKPFGYSSSRTVLQICTFWGWTALGSVLHFLKWSATQQVNQLYPPIAQVQEDDDEQGPIKTLEKTTRLSSDGDDENNTKECNDSDDLVPVAYETEPGNL